MKSTLLTSTLGFLSIALVFGSDDDCDPQCQIKFDVDRRESDFQFADVCYCKDISCGNVKRNELREGQSCKYTGSNNSPQFDGGLYVRFCGACPLRTRSMEGVTGIKFIEDSSKPLRVYPNEFAIIDKKFGVIIEVKYVQLVMYSGKLANTASSLQFERDNAATTLRATRGEVKGSTALVRSLNYGNIATETRAVAARPDIKLVVLTGGSDQDVRLELQMKDLNVNLEVKVPSSLASIAGDKLNIGMSANEVWGKSGNIAACSMTCLDHGACLADSNDVYSCECDIGLCQWTGDDCDTERPILSLELVTLMHDERTITEIEPEDTVQLVGWEIGDRVESGLYTIVVSDVDGESADKLCKNPKRISSSIATCTTPDHLPGTKVLFRAEDTRSCHKSETMASVAGVYKGCTMIDLQAQMIDTPCDLSDGMVGSQEVCGCTCREGWTGHECRTCKNDDACGVVGDGDYRYCDTAFQWHEKSSTKVYDCTHDDLYAGVAVQVSCDMEKGECGALFGLPNSEQQISEVDTFLTCRLWDCDVAPTSGSSALGSDVHCKELDCTPAKLVVDASPEIADKLDKLYGVSVFNCETPDLPSSECFFNIEQLEITLRAQCSVSECIKSWPSRGFFFWLEWMPIRIWTILVILVVAFLCFCVALKPHRMLWSCYTRLCKAQVKGIRREKREKPEEEQPDIGPQLAMSNSVLEWKDIYVELPAKKAQCGGKAKEKRVLLDTVSGKVTSGKCLAVMGPSGCGKTTLLNVIGRTGSKGIKIAGQLSLAIEDRGDDASKSYSVSFVRQEDVFMSTFTCLEAVLFSAQLRVRGAMAMTTEELTKLAMDALLEMHIKHIADTKIGDPHNRHSKGISGGERRRLSIAQDLVTSPRVILLDEPTSGLDSRTARNVIKMLTILAKKNRIVIFSIHQPSLPVFQAFDKLCLLSKGTMVYFGRAKDVGDFFQFHGFPTPQGTTIADHMLEVVDHTENLEKLLGSMESKSHVAEPETPRVAGAGGDGHNFVQEHHHGLKINIKLPSKFYFYELKLLWARSCQNIFRNPSLMKLQMGMSFVLGLFGGAIFWEVTDDLQGFQNRLGAIYFCLSFFAFSTLSVMDIFISERSLFLRERSTKYYTASTYFATKAFADAFFLRLLPTALYCIVFYPMMGLQMHMGKFFIFLVTMCLMNILCGAFCIVMSIIGKSVGVANLLATMIMLVFLLFGGFLLNASTMPDYAIWLKVLSFFSYAFEVLLCNEMVGVSIQVAAPGYPVVFIKGEILLDAMAFNPDNQTPNMWVLVGMTFAYFLLGYLGLKMWDSRRGARLKMKKLVISHGAAGSAKPLKQVKKFGFRGGMKSPSARASDASEDTDPNTASFTAKKAAMKRQGTINFEFYGASKMATGVDDDDDDDDEDEAQ